MTSSKRNVKPFSTTAYMHQSVRKQADMLHKNQSTHHIPRPSTLTLAALAVVVLPGRFINLSRLSILPPDRRDLPTASAAT